MSKPRKANPAEKIPLGQALAELPAAEAALRSDSAEYFHAYEQSIRELRRLQGVMAHERARVVAGRLRVDLLKDAIDIGNGKSKRALIYRLVPNPMITQGLIDAVADGEVATQHDASQMAALNETLLVGGLARVKSKTEAQFLAATKYCNLFERSQIGGARAQDYTQVRVDTSGPRQDQIGAGQDEARTKLDQARKAMGERATSIVDQVVVFGVSIRGVAQQMGHGEGGQARRRAEKELLEALDVLVKHFNLLPKNTGKARGWTDGTRAVKIDPLE